MEEHAARETLRVAVLGPGGIGGLLAALLARSGDSVEVLARETTSRAIAARGLRVESVRFGDFQDAVLAAAGLVVRVRDDETSMLWDKLSFLAPLALMTTHERADAGAIRGRRREETLAVISEVAAVAAADGVAIDPAAVARFLDSVPET